MPSMIDIVLVLILLLIIGVAVAYIVRAKKSGAKCIGCPASGACLGKNGGQSACHGGCHTEESGECCCGSSEETHTEWCCDSTEETHTGCCCGHSDTNE